jgi:hypothetical protein
LKKDLERQAWLDKERYDREIKAWYASRGETCVETTSKVDAVKVDDVTLTATVAFVRRRIEIVDKAWYLL